MKESVGRKIKHLESTRVNTTSSKFTNSNTISTDFQHANISKPHTTFDKFELLYFNSLSIANKTDSLNTLLNLGMYDFIFLTETWLKPHHFTSSLFDNSIYTMYRADRPIVKGGGVAVLVKNKFASSINLVNIENQENFDILAFDYFVNSRTFARFVCVYFPPQLSKKTDEVTTLTKTLLNMIPKKEATQNFYVIGDFNFSEIDWKYLHTKTCRPSFTVFKNFLHEQNLTQLIKSPTHIYGNTLDLFFTNNTQTVLDVKVSEPFALTCDHNTIEMTLALPKSRPPLKTSKRNFYRANYDSINTFLNSYNWSDILNGTSDINIAYKQFSDIVQLSVEEFVPCSKSGKKISLPKNIRSLLSKKKRMYRKMKQDPSLKDEYKKLAKKYKSLVAFHMKSKEEKFIQSRNKKVFHSYIKQKLGTRTCLPPLLNENGETIVDSKGKANLLNNHFSKAFINDLDKNIPTLPSFTHPFNTMPTFTITQSDVQKAIKRLKSSVSHTPDGIPSLFLKRTSKSLAKPLSMLFNMSLKYGKIPDVWRNAIVTPIFKKGRTNTPSNYRPISLTSVVCRLMESIIHMYISIHLRENNLLSTLQHGFISKRSTLTQQLCFFNNLTSKYNKKETCQAVYIDFSKAFDRISHHKLMHVLYHFKINQHVLDWIHDFLNKRVQHTLVDGEASEKCSVVSGVPQGSVLGPLLFVLYLNSLIQSLSHNTSTTTVYAYADDLKILSSNNTDLQETLNIIQNWAKDWHFFIQPIKSEHILFSTRSNTSNPPHVFHINDGPIPHCNSVRDLGITLSSNFKWSAQIAKSTSRANYLIYNIFRSFKSCNPSLYVNLFKMHVRPLLEYNTAIWNPSLITDVKAIEKVQRNFTRRLCRKSNIKYTGYLNRLEILKLESLECRRVKLDLTILYKILHNLIEIDFEDFFHLSESTYNLRRHNVQIKTPKYTGSAIRQSFFSHRIVPCWNKLPQNVVSSPNLEVFKFRLKKLDISNIYTTKL